jgi:hypothetical protein
LLSVNIDLSPSLTTGISADPFEQDHHASGVKLEGNLVTKFPPFSGHGLCGVCRGVVAVEIIVESADVFKLRIPPGGVVSVNESGDPLSEFGQGCECVPVVVFVF